MDKKKIAIVGSATTSCRLAPFDDPSWEIWNINKNWMWAPRTDLMFELHNWDYLQKTHGDQMQWLLSQQGEYPLYMQKQIPQVKGSLEFPLRDVIKYFKGTTGEFYFTNTISYLLAFAIMQEPQEIGIYGVDMATTEEYKAQRASCEYFLGYAEGKGIKCYLPDECDLMKCRELYGYKIKTGQEPPKRKARKQDLEARCKELERALQDAHVKFLDFCRQTEAKRAALMGALEEIDYNQQWVNPGESDLTVEAFVNQESSE